MSTDEGSGRETDWVQLLLHWYREAARDLPWRRTDDPYAIWVSEVMLQQTRVETVREYYCRFLAAFPTVGALARAPEGDVLQRWEGLGYYSRARNLHRAAQLIHSDFGGRLPGDYDLLLKLPGIGPYTAGAVASIAFDLPHPAPDGNARRVFARLFGCTGNIGQEQTKRSLAERMAENMPADDPGEYNQAIMELGATVCTPQNPGCDRCPVRAHCRAKERDRQHLLPVASRRRPPKEIMRCVFGVQRGEDFLLRRRPETGLLGGFWELPGGECPDDRAVDWVLARLGLRLKQIESLGDYHFAFTHQRWHVHIYRGQWVPSSLPPGRTLRWFSPAELREIALPRAFLPVAERLGLRDRE